MSKIIEEVLTNIPKDLISDAVFEGANIVLYTKNKDFFLDNRGLIKDAVDSVKKRVELRPDPALCLEQEKTEKIIREAIPEEAKIDNIIFDPQRSIVIVETEKPGVGIGKNGEILKFIREKTLWVPVIRRTPAIRSQIIENIRGVLYQNSDYRRKFLHKIGARIYNGWTRSKKEVWVRLSFLGAGRQVGRSCFLLQTNESRVLLDCGIDVASEEHMSPHFEAPEFNINEVDAVVVSHSHLDHSALIPFLFKAGYKGPVYCTAPTRDVMSLLQLDLIKIARNDGKDPMYTSEDIKEMVKHTVTLEFEEVTDITPDIRLTFYNSGHILGSAMVHLHIGNGLHNFLYSADMKYGKSFLLNPAATKFPRLETMMMEATYGGKDNILPDKDETKDLLRSIIKDTVARGGKILIPVLGTGRAQDVMVILEELVRNQEIEPFEVYIDGLVWDITAIHTAYPEYLNSAIRKQIFHKDNNPFLNPMFKRIGSAKEREQLLHETGSCVILATSGMLVGGPSVQYFRELASSDRNSMIFSCYQGEGSLGRRIQRGEREITFKNSQKNDIVEVKMEVHRLEISDHSDRRELMNFVQRCSPRPKKIFTNHGEATRCLDLASSIHKMFRIETQSPRNLETVRLK
jgi:hypothetical protein